MIGNALRTGFLLAALGLALAGCSYAGAPDPYDYIRQPSYPSYGGYLAAPANRAFPYYNFYYSPPPGLYPGSPALLR
jgi:hypothetical protein